jgi:hypothetical protein
MASVEKMVKFRLNQKESSPAFDVFPPVPDAVIAPTPTASDHLTAAVSRRKKELSPVGPVLLDRRGTGALRRRIRNRGDCRKAKDHERYTD